MSNQNILIPVKLDAFVFNEAVCNGGPGKAKIAPIAQPNYSFLRLSDSYLQSDILYSTDLHNAAPADDNSRLNDLGTRTRRTNRQGVYLHWTIPRVYRSGTAADRGDGERNGLPDFPEPPTRWLVVRHIHDLGLVKPAEAAKALKPVTGWIVESDRCRTLDGPRRNGELIDKENVLPIDLDLQVDVSPFVSPPDDVGNGNVLDKQAEVFIGDKIDATTWQESVPAKKGEDPKKRVNLQLMGSSNELFADFQPHCPNVFSIVDNFSYQTEDDSGMKYATEVSASYSVIGWNSKPDKDIAKPRGNQSREQRFRELKMSIKGFQNELEPMAKYPKAIFEWFEQTKGGTEEPVTRSICHGAMYDVQWIINKAPKTVLADHYASLLCDAQPVSVGSTPMDALMAYAGAHQNIDNGIKKDLEAALKRLETILLSRDDGVEAHAQATDMLYNWNYSRLDGGDQFHVAASGDQTGKDKKPTIPKEKKKQLIERNQLCRLRDAAMRKLKQQQWAVFSEWWLSVSRAKGNEPVKATLEPILASIKELKEKVDWCNEQLGIKPKEADPDTVTTTDEEVKDFEPGVHPPYHQQRDPTLLVGGVRSGWEPDYLLALLVRLDCQLPPDVLQPLPDEALNGWGNFLKNVIEAKLPSDLYKSVQYLLREFVTMRTRRDEEQDDGHPQVPSMLVERGLFRSPDEKLVDDLYFTADGEKKEPERAELKPEIPLFHDRLGLDLKGAKIWRDYWNDTQPWFPLYMEWEVEYTHVDHQDWELSTAKWWHSEHSKLHYGVKEGLDLANKYDPNVAEGQRAPVIDRRQLSGRVLILPQPSFSLQTKIAQLLSNTLPSQLKEYIPDEDLKFLDKNLQQLQFLSAPLAGFDSHMVTLEQGNHVKPSLRDPRTGMLTVLPEAYRPKAGLNGETMPKMDIETDLTPYGRVHKPIAGPEGPASFKPVAHGQFRLTKLNIFDRFGQAIHAIDPEPVPYNQKTPTVAPCISDWYAPGIKVGKEGVIIPNVVEQNKTGKDQKCEYVQVPPRINQPARLNAVWTMPYTKAKPEDMSQPFWRATNDWDQPIWGWVVVNYANYGLQFFLPSGAFYREVRQAGPLGAQISPEWLPFPEPDDPEERGGEQDGGVAAKQLARLVQALSKSQGYLLAFIAMVNAATTSKGTTAPDAYAEFRSALIGKPLALVNMGYSLELAGPALESRLNDDGKVVKKLYANTAKKGVKGPGFEDNDEYDEKYYRFPVKLGDRDRAFDGLVGYFKTKSDAKPGDALHLDKIYSHFSPGSKAYETEFHKFSSYSAAVTAKSIADAEERIIPISAKNYPRLPPHYIELTDRYGSVMVEPDEYEAITNEQLCVFGAIVDPFSPVHAFSGILPVKELALPNWTWEGPLDRLSAFFHMGPLLVTRDVPDFVDSRKLAPGDLPPKVVENNVSKKEKASLTNGVALPGGALEQWTWLQPYMPAPTRVGATQTEQFMPLAIDPVDQKARLERGPYTAVEGYLQMAAGAVDNGTGK
ncbi:hypothetical protein GGS20DRAFT_587464 [Poronia punctata]|nr:hypothetical protein GGS20DRAFT_587464 [Poronia punctata]